jgi:hypothetical protein
LRRELLTASRSLLFGRPPFGAAEYQIINLDFAERGIVRKVPFRKTGKEGVVHGRSAVGVLVLAVFTLWVRTGLASDCLWGSGP